MSETVPSAKKKRVLVSYGVDIDAIAGWLGSYKGEDSTSDISRGRWPESSHIKATSHNTRKISETMSPHLLSSSPDQQVTLQVLKGSEGS